MPFTPAHSAIVLPFLKISPRFISATGLIIGSMAPDFEYFFKMSVNGEHSHTLPGLLYFDIPVTVVLAFIFHLIVKRNLIDNLPGFLSRRFQELRQFDFVGAFKEHYAAFLISALLGSASHIFWDGFTHGDGYFVVLFSFQTGYYVPFDHVNYPLWYALQHISTAVGLFVVCTYILLMKRQPPSDAKPSMLYWVVLSSLIVLVVGLRFNFDPGNAPLGNFVVSSISAFCIALVVVGFLPQQKLTTQPERHG